MDRGDAAEGGFEQVNDGIIVQDLVDRPELGVPELSPSGSSTSKTLRCAYARRTMAPPWRAVGFGALSVGA